MVGTQTNAGGTGGKAGAALRANIEEIIQKRLDLLAENNRLKAEAWRLAVKSRDLDLIGLARCW